MSTVYNGIAGNVTPPSALTITGVTAGATPTITVSGALPGSIVTTFTVTITGVQGATGINGSWTGTKTGASTFTIPSGAPGTFSATGTPLAQPILLQAITIPADGDTRSAASVNVPLEALQDQVAFLASSVGQLKNPQYFNFQTSFTLNSAIASCPNTSGTVWADWTGLLTSFMPFASSDAQTINVEAGDVVRVTFQSNLLMNGANNNCGVAIWFANWVPGGTETFLQANGNGAQVRNLSASTFMFPFTLTAYITMSTTGLFDFKVRLITTSNATAGDFALIGVWAAEAIVYRGNLVPQ